MKYEKPEDAPPGPIRSYIELLHIPRGETTQYHLERPNYDTEDEYAHIREAWIVNRVWWTKKHGEPLPRPKRKAGRPATQEKLEEERQRAARRAEREARKAAKSVVYATTLRLGIDMKMLVAIEQVRGEMPLDACIRELIRNALGPLIEA